MSTLTVSLLNTCKEERKYSPMKIYTMYPEWPFMLGKPLTVQKKLWKQVAKVIYIMFLFFHQRISKIAATGGISVADTTITGDVWAVYNRFQWHFDKNAGNTWRIFYTRTPTVPSIVAKITKCSRVLPKTLLNVLSLSSHWSSITTSD